MSQTNTMGGATNVADLIERVLDKGVVIAGDIKVKLLDIELLTLQIRLVVCSVDKAVELGLDWWSNHPAFTGQALETPGRTGVAAESAASETQPVAAVSLDQIQELRQRCDMLEQQYRQQQGEDEAVAA